MLDFDSIDDLLVNDEVKKAVHKFCEERLPETINLIIISEDGEGKIQLTSNTEHYLYTLGLLEVAKAVCIKLNLEPDSSMGTDDDA